MMSSIAKLLAIFLCCLFPAAKTLAQTDFSRYPSPTFRSVTLPPAAVSDLGKVFGHSSILEVAKCDGSDETTVIQNYLNTRPVGTTVHGAPGKWCYVKNLSIPGGITFMGPSEVPANPGGSHFQVRYAEMGGIRLENTGTITTNGASGFKNWIVVRADNGTPMAIPADNGSAYKGVCITTAPPSGTPGTTSYKGSDDTTIDEVLCIGQAQALVAVESSRLRVGRFSADVNPGVADRAAVLISKTHDTVRIRDVHLWPYGRSNKLGAALENTGVGIHVLGQNDGLQIDGALTINFDQDVVFENTAAVDIGRLWTDSSQRSRNGTRGVLFKGGVSNVNISLLECWGHQIGIEHNVGDGNRNSIGIAHFDGQYGYQLLLAGGNLHIGNATIRNTPADQSPIAITSAASFLSGLFNDENNGNLAPVTLPAGYDASKLKDFRIVSPYRPLGSYSYRGNPAIRTAILGGARLALPPYSDYIDVASAPDFSIIDGGIAERKISLYFRAPGTIYSGGNIRTQGGGNRAIAADSIMELSWDSKSDKWVETFYTGGGSGGGGSSEDPPWTAFSPSVSFTGGGFPSGFSATGYYLKKGKTVHVTVTLSSSDLSNAQGNALLSLPVLGARANVVLVGADYAATGRLVTGRPYQGSNAQVVLLDQTNTNPFVPNGAGFTISGTYEAQ